eukprot:m.208463 g.208463  ORF g.208463 m.208463 type:complete len:169 (-) comp24152_c0_seq1:133-639(-)
MKELPGRTDRAILSSAYSLHLKIFDSTIPEDKEHGSPRGHGGHAAASATSKKGKRPDSRHTNAAGGPAWQRLVDQIVPTGSADTMSQQEMRSALAGLPRAAQEMEARIESKWLKKFEEQKAELERKANRALRKQRKQFLEQQGEIVAPITEACDAIKQFALTHLGNAS